MTDYGKSVSASVKELKNSVSEINKAVKAEAEEEAKACLKMVASGMEASIAAVEEMGEEAKKVKNEKVKECKGMVGEMKKAMKSCQKEAENASKEGLRLKKEIETLVEDVIK